MSLSSMLSTTSERLKMCMDDPRTGPGPVTSTFTFVWDETEFGRLLGEMEILKRSFPELTHVKEMGSLFLDELSHETAQAMEQAQGQTYRRMQQWVEAESKRSIKRFVVQAFEEED